MPQHDLNSSQYIELVSDIAYIVLVAPTFNLQDFILPIGEGSFTNIENIDSKFIAWKSNCGNSRGGE
jgi:hypothetical protein